MAGAVCRLTLKPHQQLLVLIADDIACEDLLSFLGFHLAVQQYFAVGNFHLGETAAWHQPFELERFIQLDGFACDFERLQIEYSFQGI